MTDPTDSNKKEHSGVDPDPVQQVVESNTDGEDKAPTCDSLTDNTNEEPFNSLKEYFGKEWSELEHLLNLPADLKKHEDEDFYDWSQISSQASTDTHDDALAEDIHDLVNVWDNVLNLGSNSNLSCDEISVPIIEHLNLDIFKYETLLAEVTSWPFDEDDVLTYPAYYDTDNEP